MGSCFGLERCESGVFSLEECFALAFCGVSSGTIVRTGSTGGSET